MKNGESLARHIGFGSTLSYFVVRNSTGWTSFCRSSTLQYGVVLDGRRSVGVVLCSEE